MQNLKKKASIYEVNKEFEKVLLLKFGWRWEGEEVREIQVWRLSPARK